MNSLLFLLVAAAMEAQTPPSRAPICNMERSGFKSYSLGAGPVIPLDRMGNPYVFMDNLTSEGVKLCGYRISSYLRTGTKRRGYVLFAQGNGTLASRMIRPLSRLSASGFDVYVYDYRGYGCSKGEALALNMFHDYSAIISKLNSWYRDEVRVLYGVSWGGIVLLNSVKSSQDYDSLIIDATPDTLPWYLDCPDEIDPKTRLQTLGPGYRNVLLIRNEEDDQVKPRNMKEMKSQIENGTPPGSTHLFEDLGHPFKFDKKDMALAAPTMPEDAEARIRFISDYLTGVAAREGQVP